MSEHIEVSTVICHIWSDIVFLCIEIIILTIHTRKLIITDLKFRLNVIRICGFYARNCSSGDGLRKCVTLFPNLRAIYGNNESYSSVVQCSHDSDCSD